MWTQLFFTRSCAGTFQDALPDIRHVPGRIVRHQALNDVVHRALCSAVIPAFKEPSGLVQQDGRRPDGMTLIPWQTGKQLVWDVTVIITLAVSYVDRAAQ